MLRRHPDLRFVGLHLASQEWDTSEVASFLDEFPKAMIDTAERICHLQYQAVTDWQKVYDFFISYQDQIIYGSDFIDDNTLDNKELIAGIHERHQMDWDFLTEKQPMTVPGLKASVKGLGLPPVVVEKICNTNAGKAYRI
jgi:predicted TIM-barrel fold metal-dependent hydrolase